MSARLALLATGALVAVAGLSACGGDDDSGGADAEPVTADGANIAEPIDGVFQGEAFTLTSGVAGALGDTVLDISALADFGIVLSDQPISCGTDLAARPPPGMYAVLYLDELIEGTFSPSGILLLRQTAGPRTSSTRVAGTTALSRVDATRVVGTADHDYAPDEDSSLQGTFDVQRCP